MDATMTVYIGLGSSLGDRLGRIQAALTALHQPRAGVSVMAVSPVYESAHVGLAPEDATRYPPHLNAVARLETAWDPHALLDLVKRVEAEGERDRSVKWGPR